jgi:hypothetical protein
MSIDPHDLQKMPDELEASKASRKRAWENLQEIRYVLSEDARLELPPPARKTIDLEGRIVERRRPQSDPGATGRTQQFGSRHPGISEAGRIDPIDFEGRRGIELRLRPACLAGGFCLQAYTNRQDSE